MSDRTNADFTDEYFDILDELDGDIPSRRAAYNYMQNSTAIVHHEVVACSFVPRLFNKKTYSTMKSAAEMTHRILSKVMQRYLDDPHYRELRLRRAPERTDLATAWLRLDPTVRPRGHIHRRGHIRCAIL